MAERLHPPPRGPAQNLAVRDVAEEQVALPAPDRPFREPKPLRQLLDPRLRSHNLAHRRRREQDFANARRLFLNGTHRHRLLYPQSTTARHFSVTPATGGCGRSQVRLPSNVTLRGSTT